MHGTQPSPKKTCCLSQKICVNFLKHTVFGVINFVNYVDDFDFNAHKMRLKSAISIPFHTLLDYAQYKMITAEKR